MKALRRIAATAVVGLAVLWSMAQLYSYWAVVEVNAWPLRSFSGMMTRSTWEARMMWPLGYEVVTVVHPSGLALGSSEEFKPYTRTEKHYLFTSRTEKRPIE